jgi:hypothetical protein
MKKTYAVLGGGGSFGLHTSKTWQEGMSEMVEWGRKYLPQLKTLPTDFVMRA